MKHQLTALLLVALCAPAIAQNNMCVPRALGVPTRDGPPDWLRTRTSTVNHASLPPNTALDDPRWLGATGQSFGLGSAKAPLQARALYSTADAAGAVTKYLYLSFIIDLDAYYTDSTVVPRDLFVGFRRPGAPAGGDRGYIFQFHLTSASSGADPNGMQPTPASCDAASTCDEDAVDAAHRHDYWRVFVDRGNQGTWGCGSPTAAGRSYDKLASASAAWMTGAPTGDAVRYWKVATGDPSPFLQNRWAVQLRVPIIAANAAAASTLATGIEDGSTFFYEATGRLTAPDNNGTFAPIGWYPSTMTRSLCPNTDTDVLISADMSDADSGSGCTTCSPAKFAGLTDLGVSSPPTCDGGIDIDADHVGVLNTAIPADHETLGYGAGMTPLAKTFSGGTAAPVVNHVIALPLNTTAATITPHLQARFRLAEWGSAPWAVPGDLGQWADMRGAKNGVCAVAPSAGQTCGASPIDGGKHGLITFDWTIGNDTGAGGLGASEYCQFGLTPPSGQAACASCTPPGGGSGTRSGTWPCVPVFYQDDQCMLVELSSPDAAATFVHQSIWSNMRFGEMSTLAHEALIDARKLPIAPGQQSQDIYFVAVPRNMPASVAPTTTSVQLVQNAAINLALHIAQPYLDDLARNQQISIPAAPRALAVVVGRDDKRIQQILRARAVMSAPDLQRVDGLLTVGVAQSQADKPSQALVHTAVGALGSSAAAEVVPTLDIYPFYRAGAAGKLYLPMTSFSLFLSHENTLAGITYTIDGADRVGANIYHLTIPVGYARTIQVRAQALGGSDPPLGPGMPKWPCTAGGCAGCGGGRCGLVSQLGNTLPALIAGMFLLRRRRKPRARS